MNQRSSSQATLKPETAAGKAARSDRLAAEMRKNLMKRKQQQRHKSHSQPGERAESTPSKDRS